MMCSLAMQMRRLWWPLVLAALLLLRSDVCTAQTDEKWAISRPSFPQIISHRGASGYIPEHSVNAYRTAVDLGTDYIEPDLVVSKDGVFVIMHDLTLDDTTDVADSEFADRKTTRIVRNEPRTGYFASDFNVTELKTLRLKQRLEVDGRTALYDGVFTIPTFQEALDFAQEYYDNTNKLIGVYAELKEPTYHHERGWDVEQMLLDQLTISGYLVNNSPNDMQDVVPIVLQCFEAATLQTLRNLTDLPLIQLLQPTNTPYPGENPFDDSLLSLIATYADGMGPKLEYLTDMTLHDAVSAVERAHGYGLRLHPWTFRAESKYVPAQFNNSQVLEYDYFFCCLSIDGVFSEFPDQARQQIAVLNGPSPQDCFKMCPELSPYPEHDDDADGDDDDDEEDKTFIILTAVFGGLAALSIGALLFSKFRPNKEQATESASLLP